MALYMGLSFQLQLSTCQDVTPRCFYVLQVVQSLLLFPHSPLRGSNQQVFLVSAARSSWMPQKAAMRFANTPGKAYSYGHLLVMRTYNPNYRMYNPIYNQL